MRKQKGFTLIEMLIVVVIIGILASILVPRFQNAQGRGRDAVRKRDLQTITSALELYHTDNLLYPSAQNGIRNCGYNTSCYVFSWHNTGSRIGFLGGYIAIVPKDPINKLQTAEGVYAGPFYEGNFVYSYGNICNVTISGLCKGAPYYNLRAHLENKKDPERNEIRVYTYWPTRSPLSIPTYSKYLYSPNIEQATYK